MLMPWQYIYATQAEPSSTLRSSSTHPTNCCLFAVSPRCRQLVDGQIRGDRDGVPHTFFRHGADAILNAGARERGASRDGLFIFFAYSLQQVVDQMRYALFALRASPSNPSIIVAQSVEFEKMSTAR